MQKKLEELEVEGIEDLENVEVEDLTKDDLLKPIQARKLVKQWKKGAGCRLIITFVI